MQKTIWSLIGCGWLGSPLLQKFIKQYPNVQFVVTTRSQEQSQNLLLQHENIEWLRLDLEQLDSDDNKKSLERLKSASMMMYLLPPQPIDQLKYFLSFFSPEMKIIFTSSTSVYGKNLGNINEDGAHLDIQKTQSPLLVESVLYLKSHFKNSTILRLGGLYGDKRHPVFFLQGRKDCRGENELIHLCSQKDAIQAISSVVEKNVWGETIHIVSDLRIKKSVYYKTMAESLNLTPPEYLSESTQTFQTNLDNKKSKNLLGITYDNPLEYRPIKP